MGYKDDVQSEKGHGLERFGGVKFLKAGNSHAVEALGGEKGRTVFRIYPEIDGNGVELPMRKGETEDDFTYWMRPEKVIRRCGSNETFSCFVRPLGKDHKYQGPIEKFVRTLYKAFDDTSNNDVFPAQYRAWVKRSGGLPRVEYMGLLQGMLFENRGKQFTTNGVASPVHPVLLLVNKSGRKALETMANKVVNPEAVELADRFAAGDLVSSQGGKAVYFTLIPQQGNELAHYDVQVVPNPTPLDINVLRQEAKPWDELLHFHTEEEQLNMLVEHFPADIIDYVFGTSGLANLLPAAVSGSWAKRLQQAALDKQAEAIEAAKALGYVLSPTAAPAVAAPVVGAPVAPAVVAPAVVAPTVPAVVAVAPVVPAAPVVTAAPVVAVPPASAAPVMPAAPAAPVMPAAPAVVAVPAVAQPVMPVIPAPTAAAVKSPLVAVPPVMPVLPAAAAHAPVAPPIGDPAVDSTQVQVGSIRERLAQADQAKEAQG